MEFPFFSVFPFLTDLQNAYIYGNVEHNKMNQSHLFSLLPSKKYPIYMDQVQHEEHNEMLIRDQFPTAQKITHIF
jgi:hypothetical protein